MPATTKTTYAMSRAGIAFGAISFLLILACQKNNLSSSESRNSVTSKDVLLTDSLSYGDSVFSASVTGLDRRVSPLTRPSQPGYFIANLPGLDLDSASGRINLSKSESGLRYEVYYVSFEKQVIAATSVTVSGIDYKDSIYDLSDTAEEQFAAPIYNMDPTANLPCNNLENGSVCKFDETDINGDNVPEYTGANNSKLIIDTTTGSIDLKKSLAAGVFGPVPPGTTSTFLNGRRKDVTIYYRLGDSNTRTLKKITVRLVYFQSRAMIPESMQLEINSRNKRYTFQPGSAASSGDDITSLTYYYSTPKRPPLIVIVSGK